MAAGHHRTHLQGLLESLPAYDVHVTSPGDDLPETYDICLLDVASFRALRAEVAAQVAAEDPVYLPHVLLVGSTDIPEDGPDDRSDDGSVTDELVNEVVDLPVNKTVLRRRLENLLSARRTARRLAEREEQYNRLVELTPEGIVLVDGDEIVYSNSAASSLFGGDPTEDLTGRSLRSMVAPESEASLDALLDEVSDTAHGHAAEFTELGLIRADGGPVDASVAGVPVTFAGEHVIQLLFRDITEQRRRKEQLQLFGRAVESVALGIIIADAEQDDTPIVYANDGFQRLTGYSLVEILGQPFDFLQGPQTKEATLHELQRSIDAGEPASVDALSYRKDGTVFWNRVDVIPVHNDEGELTHFLGFHRDITERVQRKQRLAVLNRILRHNVRNKTNVISGYAETLAAGEADPEAAASRIIEAADELLTISEQIREFDTVIEEGSADTERLDLKQVVEESAGMAYGREEAGFDVETDVEGPTGIAAHHTLRAALNNLFTLLAEAPNPDCAVHLQRVNGHLELSIVDRAGILTAAELTLVDTGMESPLEHLQRLELWLLRWAVDQSGGVFETNTVDSHPEVRIRFETVD